MVTMNTSEKAQPPSQTTRDDTFITQMSSPMRTVRANTITPLENQRTNLSVVADDIGNTLLINI